MGNKEIVCTYYTTVLYVLFCLTYMHCTLYIALESIHNSEFQEQYSSNRIISWSTWDLSLTNFSNSTTDIQQVSEVNLEARTISPTAHQPSSHPSEIDMAVVLHALMRYQDALKVCLISPLCPAHGNSDAVP